MTSSGMKRGLAVAAISALAVTGAPAIANAVPNVSSVGDDAAVLYTQSSGVASAVNDGTNTTVSLVAGGGKNVTSVLFQYKKDADSPWTSIGSAVTRNTDGVFATEWTPAAGLTSVQLRAVPNTGEGNADSVDNVSIPAADAAHTVELASDGQLGVFHSPYAAGGHFVSVRGTASDDTPLTISVLDPSGVDGTAPATPVVPEGASTGTFAGVLDITGYNYSADNSTPNQIVLGAAATPDSSTGAPVAGASDDAEASTLYNQEITKITAVPAKTKLSSGSTKVTVTVTDQFGKPVAGALVGYSQPATKDANGNTTPVADAPVDKATDGNGQTDVDVPAGTYTFYANKTSDLDNTSGDPQASAFTVESYTPQATKFEIKSASDRAVYDFDELATTPFKAILEDQNGEGVAGETVQYRWTAKPSDSKLDPIDEGWAGSLTTGADGAVDVPAPTHTVPGQYSLEVRRPNDSSTGTGLLVSDPKSFHLADSAISFADGASAQAPVNGDATFSGVLATTDDETPLAGRTVTITYDNGVGDADFSATQPTGSKLDTSTDTVTAVTDKDGKFSVSLSDPQIPSNVTPTKESGTLTATSAVADPSSNTLAVNWAPAPKPTAIVLDVNDEFGEATPGRPVNVTANVFEDANKDGVNDPAELLKDYPVKVSVDHGYLTPDSLTPASTPKAGDLVGDWKDLGPSQDISTGDNGDASIDTAIGRDPGFDDNGLVTMTVTVKAGDLTKTEEIVFDSSNPLNGKSVELVPAPGESAGNTTMGKKVDFNLFTRDQFGNLVGGSYYSGNNVVDISDDTPLADVATDFFQGSALPDFENDTPSVTASSSNPVTQTITGKWTAPSNVYDANGDWAGLHQDGDFYYGDTKPVSGSAPAINWVAGSVRTPGQIDAFLHLGNTRHGNDVAKVNAPNAAHGATVKLYRYVSGHRKFVASKTANKYGNATFYVHDSAKRGYTKYVAKVEATSRTFKDWTPRAGIR